MLKNILGAINWNDKYIRSARVCVYVYMLIRHEEISIFKRESFGTKSEIQIYNVDLWNIVCNVRIIYTAIAIIHAEYHWSPYQIYWLQAAVIVYRGIHLAICAVIRASPRCAYTPKRRLVLFFRCRVFFRPIFADCVVHVYLGFRAWNLCVHRACIVRATLPLRQSFLSHLFTFLDISLVKRRES